MWAKGDFLMPAVFSPNEVLLFGTRFPIVGPVQLALASVWPQKLVTGDFTKDSERIASTWVLADATGGIGIKDMIEGKDDNRVYWSTCEIGYRGHIVLPVQVTDCGNPTTADAAVIIEYNNKIYVAFGTSVRRWTEGTASWTANLVTLAAVPTDGIVYKNKLYLAMGTDFERFDGTTWTDGATIAVGGAKACRYFVEWDGKLFALDNTGQLRYTTDEGVNWTNSALGTLPAGHYTSLFLYRNVAGDVIVYMGTKEGLFALDFANAKWVETELALPFHDYACLGADWWRDAAYIPCGMAVYRYVTSNPAEVSLMGPDRDYGIPGDYRGNIIKLLRGHNELIALLDATSTLAQDLYPAGLYGDVQIYDNVGFSAVLKWNEKAWSVLYLSGNLATPLKTGAVATADDIYRLWFGVDGKVFYAPLQVNIQNPLELPDFTFSAYGTEHITSWFNANNAVVNKLAPSLSCLAEGVTCNISPHFYKTYIRLWYGLDYNDDTWTLLTNTSFPDGYIDIAGEAIFDLNLSFKAIRFKALLVRYSSTPAASPDLRWLRLSYIKLLDPQFAFSMRVDCSRNYRFKTAKTLLNSLKTALETQTLGAFTFKNGNGTETHQVRIAQFQGAEIGGKKSEGIYDLQLIAP